MNIRPIHTRNDYKGALRELSACFNHEPEPGTENGDRFEILATLVEAYESKHFPVEAPDPNGTYLAPSSPQKRGSSVFNAPDSPEVTGFPPSRE